MLVSRYITRVIVSTDCKKIAKVAEDYGAFVPFIRSKKLSSDNAPELLAWRDALEKLTDLEGHMPETFISVPTTSPLRLSTDIDNCIEKFEASAADVVFAITKANRSPWFNMVKKCPKKGFSLVNSGGSVNPVVRRQDAPKVFDMTTIAYVASSRYILDNETLFDGSVAAVEVPQERAVDIDTLHDFEIAEFLLSQRISIE